MSYTRANRYPVWLAVLAAMAVPGSGHVLLGRSRRGLMFILWIFAFGYITFHLAGPGISLLGRWSGGIAVWVLSVLEVYRIAAGNK